MIASILISGLIDVLRLLAAARVRRPLGVAAVVGAEEDLEEQ